MSKSEVGPWAADKLERLRKYLDAYTKIMRKRSWCRGFYYIDAFAGPGSHEVRAGKKRSVPKDVLIEIASFAQDQEEQRRLLAGSPRMALGLEHPFTAYVFVEKNPERVAELQKLHDDYPDRRIVVRQEDCNKYLLTKVVANRQIDWKQHRALVFLDPFGMQVPWATLESLAQTQAIEVFLNFPDGMAIQRLLPRNPDKFTERKRAKLDEYFGSPDWFHVLYRKRATLFGDDSEEKIQQAGKALVKWYRDRLRAMFGYASKAALIRNTRGGYLYYLLLASPNQTGVKIASDILSAGEAV